MGNCIPLRHKSGPKKKLYPFKQPGNKYIEHSEIQNDEKTEIPYFPWNNSLYSEKARIAVYYREAMSNGMETPKPRQQRLCAVHNYKHAKEFMLYSPALSVRQTKDMVQHLWGSGNYDRFKVAKWETNKWVPSLKSLRLEFGNCEKVSDRDLEDFSSRIMRNTSCLKNLVLTFKSCRNFTNKGILKLGSEIAKNLINLETLELTFYSPDQINDTGIKEFIALLCRYLTKLQHFKFAIYNSSKIGNGSLEALGTHIGKKMINLISLDIKFYYCQGVTGKGLQALVTGISSQSLNLQSLKLNISRCRYLTGFTDAGLDELGTKISAHLLSLKHLTLQLDNTATSVQGLVDFAEQIKVGNIALKQFQLMLPGTGKFSINEKSRLPEILKMIPKFELTAESINADSVLLCL